MKKMPLYQALLLMLLLLTSALAEEEYELSYLLIESNSGKVLASLEEYKLRTPASTLKLLTSAAAIENLGLEHRYQTSLWLERSPHRGRVRGSLCLMGEADPELDAGDLVGLVEKLWASGVRRIEGDLVVDEGFYAEPPYGEGWAWDDAGAIYQPEITGLAMDGGLQELAADSLPAWLTIGKDEGASPSLQLVPGRAGAILSGALPKLIAVPQSGIHTGEVLRKLLERKGIKIKGEVRRGQTLGRMVACHQSRSLKQILHRALAVSDNLALELIYRSCKKALPSALKAESLRVVDGCGLSRYNLISCRQLVAVLKSYPALKSLLPTGGEGTLAKRFIAGDTAGLVRAKTGTLGNISALAGFLYPDTPRECIFAIMINGSLAPSADRKALENGLVQSWIKLIIDR